MLVTVFAMQVVGVSAASKTATMAVVGNSKGYYEVDAMDQEELDTVAAADKTTADLIKDINAELRHWKILQRQNPVLHQRLRENLW